MGNILLALAMVLSIIAIIISIHVIARNRELDRRLSILMKEDNEHG
jgi:hypothetical protein